MTPTPELRRCAECAAPCWSGEPRCPDCGQTFALVSPLPPSRIRFGLGSVMVIIAVVALCLGALRLAPGLGILMILVALPAQARAAMIMNRRRARGRPMTIDERIGVTLTSAGVVLMIAVASGGVFFITCATGVYGCIALPGQQGQGYYSLFAGLILGGLGGLVAGGFTLYSVSRKLWPYRELDRPASPSVEPIATPTEPGPRP